MSIRTNNVETTLSEDEVIRIFAMYFNGKAEAYKGSYTDHVSVKQVITHYMHSRSKLWLKPVDKVTDEQILKLCKIAEEHTFGDYRFAQWEIEKKISHFKDGTVQTHFAYVTNKNAPETFEVDLVDGGITIYENKTMSGGNAPIDPSYYQWWFVNGFAVPLYPYKKNAIELGIAIDITVKNKSWPKRM